MIHINICYFIIFHSDYQILLFLFTNNLTRLVNHIIDIIVDIKLQTYIVQSIKEINQKMSSDQENIKNNDIVYSDEGEPEEDAHYSSVLSQGGRKDENHQHQENQTQNTHEGKTENDEHHGEGNEPKHQEIVSIHETNEHVGIVSEPMTVQENTNDHQIQVSGHQQKHQQTHEAENQHLPVENSQNSAKIGIVESNHPIQDSIKPEPAQPVSLDITQAVKHSENDHEEEQKKKKKQQEHHQNKQHKQQHTQQNIAKHQDQKNHQQPHQKLPHNEVILSDNNYQQPAPLVEKLQIKEEVIVDANQNQITIQQKLLLPGPNKFAAHLAQQNIAQKAEQSKQAELLANKLYQKEQHKEHEDKTLSQSRQQIKKDDEVEVQQPTEIKLIKELESMELDHARAPDDSVISRRILAASVKEAPKKQQEEGRSNKVCECSVM